MAKKVKFPQKVYVEMEDVKGDGLFPITYLELEDMKLGNGNQVGVYELVEIKTMKITHDLV